jgi:hypothetical protein
MPTPAEIRSALDRFQAELTANAPAIAKILDSADAPPAARIIAADRAETDECQAGTPGCCIDHSAELRRSAVEQSPCETW